MAASPTSFDPGSPVARFLEGVLETFYGPESAQGARDPAYLRRRVSAVLDATRPPGAPEGADAAARLLEQAWATPDEHALDLGLAALHASPDCVDAYTFFGIQAGTELELAIPFFTLGLIAGFETLGQAAFESLVGSFWSAPETRPFMTALAGLARANREAGALEVAALHYQEMLRLNPNDDQGARFELLGILLEGQDHEGLTALYEAYDDGSAPFRWGAALDSFQQLGDEERSRELLAAAATANPHVAAFLTGATPFPEEVGAALAPGSGDEAALIADIQLPAWEATRHALGWLRAQLRPAEQGAAVPPAKERRSGPREV